MDSRHHSLNKMGFLTYTSQPGSCINNIKIYKSLLNHKNHIDDDSTQAMNHSRKQRAYVKGFMSKDMANYIVDKLRTDSRLFVRSTVHNSTFDDEIKLGSVNFIDDIPVALNMNFDYRYLEQIPDFRGSFNFSLPLRRTIKDIYPNIDLSSVLNIVEFDILDKEWNDNSYMWHVLNDVIKSYHDL